MNVLLIGCGNVGANMARQLVPLHTSISYTVADFNLAAAQQLAAELGANVQAIKVDYNDRTSLDAALKGADLVFNAAGPFYRSAVPVIEAAIRAKVHYIDINDDHDVADELLFKGDYDQRAKAAGIKIIIGCGSTPGLTNVVAKLLVNSMDTAQAIHLSTIVPFVPGSLSPAVIDHMMHITSGEQTQFENGQYCMKEGWAGRRDIDYKAPFGKMPGFYIGHGETVTLPHFIKGLDQVSNRIGFFPEQGNDIWRSFIDLGFASCAPLDSLGISPLTFMAQYFSSDAGREALSVDLSQMPRSVAFRVEVEGDRDGNQVSSVIEYHIPMSEPAAGKSNDPTPTCARLFVESLIRGEIKDNGVLAAEVCVDPERFVKAFAKATGSLFIAEESVLKKDFLAD
ncbi:MAG: saccharopine dehydrogenase NADP-binding domain-containing protein [Pseudomonas sp.]|jgi:saccharopine dehydrogenase-like NADP-dependent oxidoreductase|nr:saccharopine dehydrogenase NADP-binding domain-containing protein [Pseudomonas sp.]MDY0414862.1 saccharopine dehydrogenase NADP-binding domain-containing protein [Pseudomonas sp.]NLO53798.1 hypothetical protein [Gammaproteobacteria bacterium]